MAVVIYTIINDKKNYVSETMKLFNQKLTPGYSRKIDDAINFSNVTEADNTIKNFRDLHGRTFHTEPNEVNSKSKTFKSYMRQQERNELN